MFTAVSSAFVIYVQSKLDPDPNERSGAILRAIFIALNHSATADETLTAQPDQKDPPVIAALFMYVSLLFSLFAAVAAMGGKQWLGRGLGNAAGRSIIESCADRQRERDEFQKWRFSLYIKAPPIVLKIAILLLVVGFYANVAVVNTTISRALIPAVICGFLFIAVSLAGSPRHPHHAVVPIVLRIPSKKAGLSLYDRLSWPPVTTFLHRLWGDVVLLPPRIIHAVVRLSRVEMRPRPRAPPLPVTSRPPAPQFPPFRDLWESVQCKILLVALHLPQSLPSLPLPETSAPPLSPTVWSELEALAALRRANADDARCASWILWNIVKQEPLDVAIKLASTIRWFEEELDVIPPYDLIVSILGACFDSSGKLRPRSRDRAYYSARAALWIQIRVTCASEDPAYHLPLPIIHMVNRDASFPDHDLKELLEICGLRGIPRILARMYHISPGISPTHLQWTSNALLHLSWATRNVSGAFDAIGDNVAEGCTGSIPLDAILNRLLASCIFLGWFFGREMLEIQDKKCATPLFLLPQAAHAALR